MSYHFERALLQEQKHLFKDNDKASDVVPVK